MDNTHKGRLPVTQHLRDSWATGSTVKIDGWLRQPAVAGEITFSVVCSHSSWPSGRTHPCSPGGLFLYEMGTPDLVLVTFR
jgi:hypothetical protein